MSIKLATATIKLRPAFTKLSPAGIKLRPAFIELLTATIELLTVDIEPRPAFTELLTATIELPPADIEPAPASTKLIDNQLNTKNTVLDFRAVNREFILSKLLSIIAKRTKASAKPNFAIKLFNFPTAQAIFQIATKVAVIFGRQFCTRKAETVGFYSNFNKQSGAVWHALIYNTRLAKKTARPNRIEKPFLRQARKRYKQPFD